MADTKEKGTCKIVISKKDRGVMTMSIAPSEKGAWVTKIEILIRGKRSGKKEEKV